MLDDGEVVVSAAFLSFVEVLFTTPIASVVESILLLPYPSLAAVTTLILLSSSSPWTESFSSSSANASISNESNESS